MAPFQRNSNGRSPFVNPLQQITSFFSKTTSSSPPLKQQPKSTPKTNPNSSPSIPRLKSGKIRLFATGSSQPATTDPILNSVSIPEPAITYGEEVVGRRIKVLSSLEKSCNEGFISSFNNVSGKHLVQYDDATEELLDLTVEKIELAEPVIRKFRRLRRVYAVQDEDDEKMSVANGVKVLDTVSKRGNDDKFEIMSSKRKRAKK
ncbi:DNA mismatch repair protein MSH6-like [Impatiens glandulifera]|uniref:DNA mismatch repair protein MSH6-like n=1 Tax=Impatiens glandulifera TaxID=253017 RepID=UPI001FB18439|nr:DNA mismatch repair protein MSH6-like [Impatiens glandulifera]